MKNQYSFHVPVPMKRGPPVGPPGPKRGKFTVICRSLTDLYLKNACFNYWTLNLFFNKIGRYEQVPSHRLPKYPLQGPQGPPSHLGPSSNHHQQTQSQPNHSNQSQNNYYGPQGIRKSNTLHNYMHYVCEWVTFLWIFPMNFLYIPKAMDMIKCTITHKTTVPHLNLKTATHNTKIPDILNTKIRVIHRLLNMTKILDIPKSTGKKIHTICNYFQLFLQYLYISFLNSKYYVLSTWFAICIQLSGRL